MTAIAEKVREEALELSIRERAEIARTLIRSITPPVDAISEKELKTLLDQRLAELEDGRVKAIPAEVVFERIRQKFL